MRIGWLLAFAPVLALSAELVEKATTGQMFWDARKAGHVMCAARDGSSGKVWVGTEDAGVWCLEGNQWTQYTTKQGLGDDHVYAVAVDFRRRVWVGHLNHGVSVFDGKTWKNYDAMSGPLGSRVFAIKVCPNGPRAGEVWVASDLGMARYWPKEDAWSYVTRAEGLPSDQVQCMAFDPDGRMIAGTQCDGLAIASPEDGYAMWTAVSGPDRAGTEATGGRGCRRA
jgi:ligand-binding sensor domain-containing protein